jgi:4-carboxymuconolactone decarboxylase
MRAIARALVSLCLAAAFAGTGASARDEGSQQMDLQAVAPDLAKYREDIVLGDLWKRPHLSPRDRGIVTVSALIARDQTIELRRYMEMALDNGVKPSEVCEIITHLAFYSGSGNAMDAVAVAAEVFKARGITAAVLQSSAHPLPLNEPSEAERAKRNDDMFGAIAPGLLKYTTELLFRDLWLRPGLSPRDRSLVTVSALIASGQVAQITYHLNRAMDNGLTRAEAGEMLAHLAFYAGWPKVFSALPVVKDVLAKRADK